MSEAEAVLEALNVSRETSDRLKVYAALLEKWNPKINLVSKNSLSQLWVRHIMDSVQVFGCTTANGHWVDLGSGGGFPGLVVACLAAEKAPNLRVTLIESDQRKSAFLRTVVRETGLKTKVVVDRIESTPPQGADILSARALTDLSGLLAFTGRHLKTDGTALFQKGASWEKELAKALTEWSFEYDPITSMTEPDAIILKIRGVSCV